MSLFRNNPASSTLDAIPDVDSHPLVISARQALNQAKADAQAETEAMTDVERRLEALEARQGIRAVRERDQRVADAEAALTQARSDAAREIRADHFEPAYQDAVKRLAAALQEAAAANQQVLDLFMQSEGLRRHGGRALPELHWPELTGAGKVQHWLQYAEWNLSITLQS